MRVCLLLGVVVFFWGCESPDDVFFRSAEDPEAFIEWSGKGFSELPGNEGRFGEVIGFELDRGLFYENEPDFF